MSEARASAPVSAPGSTQDPTKVPTQGSTQVPTQAPNRPTTTEPGFVPAPRVPSEPARLTAVPRALEVRQGLVPRDRLRLLFGLEVAALTMSEVVDRAAAAIGERHRLLVGVLNAAKVVKLRRDGFLRDSLLACDLLLADGQAVVWAGRFLGRPLPERVAGIDLFTSLMDLADRDHRRVYLLGARQDVLDKVLAVAAERWPGAVVAGSRDGYFEEADSAAVATQIAESRADMLFLAMTTPKKEIFLGSYADGMGVPVLHGVGGSFDVIAGVTRRAPLRWQQWGLEWAYRLLQEPRRLWRRYLVTNSLFVGVLLQERVHRRRAYQLNSLSGGKQHG